MFVALHEMRRLAGRFVLLTGAVALLVILLLFFQTIAGALTTGLTGGVENNQADVLVYSDRARKNPAASFLTSDAVDAVAAVDGVEQAAGVARGQFTDSSSKNDVTVIGLDDIGFGGPADIANGRLPNQLGEALVSTPGLNSGGVSYEVGDTLTVEGVDLTVVGTSKDAAFDVSATLYVNFDDLQSMNDNNAGTEVPTLLSWVAVAVADGHDVDDVAERINRDAEYTPEQGSPPAGVGDVAGPTDGADDPPTTTAPDTVPNTSADKVPSTRADSVPDTVADTAPESATTEVSTPPTTLPTSVPNTSDGDGLPTEVEPPTDIDISATTALSGGLEAVDRAAASAALPGVGQISQSFNILYLLLFVVVTIVTGVFFLILTVQKQDSLVLMRALGASRSDAVRPVLVEVLAVVGVGSVVGAGAAAGMLYLLRDTFGSTLSPVTTAISVVFILVLGVIASLAAVRRVLAVDPVQAARKRAG